MSELNSALCNEYMLLPTEILLLLLLVTESHLQCLLNWMIRFSEDMPL